MRVRLIHGIHEPEGNSNMRSFAPAVRGAMPKAEVLLFEYGFMGFWAARWQNDSIARKLALVSHGRQGDGHEVWITHSNGAAVAYQAVVDHGASPDMIININPALDRWRAAPVPFIEIAHSQNDRAVNVSQWLPGHIWGDQGRAGHGSTLLRIAEKPFGTQVSNYNASRFAEPMAYEDHCGMFHGEARRWHWANFWASRIAERLGGV